MTTTHSHKSRSYRGKRLHGDILRRYRSAFVVVVIFAGLGSFFIYQSFAANANLPGDLDNDNKVGLSDLSMLLSKWNTTYTDYDLNTDGKIGLQDLSVLLSNFNKTYSPTTPTPTPTTPTPPTPTPPTSSVSLLKPVTSYTTKKNLSYGSNGSDNQLDLYIPNGNGGPYPLVIYVHGGGWSEGNKEDCASQSDPGVGNMDHQMLLKGFAVACINYRLTNGGATPFPAQIIDTKAAIRYLRANASQYGIYPTKIGVWGDSAGGHLVAFAGTSGGQSQYDVGSNLTTSSNVQAVVDYFGPTDFINNAQTNSSAAGCCSSEAYLIGGEILKNQAKAIAANPITYIDANDPPFLIYHGTSDTTVPIKQSQLLDTALRGAGVSSKLNTYQGAGHEDLRFYATTPVNEVMAFFDSILR
jgi:acetyl esterase/lipase